MYTVEYTLRYVFTRTTRSYYSMNPQLSSLVIIAFLVSGCVQDDNIDQKTNPMPSTTTTQNVNTPANNEQHESNDKLKLYDSVKREIEVLSQENPVNGIGPDHYNRIKSDLDSMANFIPNSDIEALKQLLEAIKPKGGPVETQADSTACVSNTNPMFTAHITDTATVKAVTPPRNEKTHSHVWIKDDKKVPVYIPTDAKLAAGSKYTENGEINYLLFFDVSCEVELKFDHLEELVPVIGDMFPNPPKTDDTRTEYLTAVEFKAGDLIGYTTGTPAAKNWDFGVYNKAKPNHLNGKEGYAELDMRADCPYDYFTADKKQFYYNLFVSKAGDGTPPPDFCKK